MVVFSNGRSAYAPITALAVQNGALVANRPGYPHQLASAAALARVFDAGWLSWNRGHLGSVKPLLAATPDHFYTAIRRGVWLHTTADLRLDDPNIQVALATIQPPVRAAYGRLCRQRCLPPGWAAG